MVPESEWRIPTLIVSCAAAGKALVSAIVTAPMPPANPASSLRR